MYHDLTKGNIFKTLILFALPMIAENLLQQFYNIADTLIVGLSMDLGALFSIYRCVFMGIAGAAFATILSQYISGIGITLYVLIRCKELAPSREEMKYNRQILNLSSLTCIQQSIMNFGILMVQDFGNAYSTFIAQNYGAGNTERIRDGCDCNRRTVSPLPSE